MLLFHHMKVNSQNMKSKLSSTVLIKAIQILDIFPQIDKPVNITELAALTNLNISTVYRIVNVLADHGYLRQEGKRGKYTVGLKFLKFNSMLMNTLKIREVALPFMEKLRTISEESTNLAILDGDEAVYIEHIESNHTLRTFTVLGNKVPLHCTGVGKVFCAYMDEELLYRSIIKKPLIRLTENTIPDYATLLKELSVIKREGVALDNGEMDIDVRCVAAPVFNAEEKVIAAVSVSGPYTRLPDDRVKELKPLVKKYAMEISNAMGYGLN
jgi:DNA-binding IclR family transcriptional regulator